MRQNPFPIALMYILCMFISTSFSYTSIFSAYAGTADLRKTLENNIKYEAENYLNRELSNQFNLYNDNLNELEKKINNDFNNADQLKGFVLSDIIANNFDNYVFKSSTESLNNYRKEIINLIRNNDITGDFDLIIIEQAHMYKTGSRFQTSFVTKDFYVFKNGESPTISSNIDEDDYKKNNDLLFLIESNESPQKNTEDQYVTVTSATSNGEANNLIFGINYQSNSINYALSHSYSKKILNKFDLVNMLYEEMYDIYSYVYHYEYDNVSAETLRENNNIQPLSNLNDKLEDIKNLMSDTDYFNNSYLEIYELYERTYNQQNINFNLKNSSLNGMLIFEPSKVNLEIKKNPIQTKNINNLQFIVRDILVSKISDTPGYINTIIDIMSLMPFNYMSTENVLSTENISSSEDMFNNIKKINKWLNYHQINKSDYVFSFNMLFGGWLGIGEDSIKDMYKSWIVALILMIIAAAIDLMPIFIGYSTYKAVYSIKINEKIKEMGYLNYEVELENAFKLIDEESIRKNQINYVEELLFGNAKVINGYDEYKTEMDEILETNLGLGTDKRDAVRIWLRIYYNDNMDDFKSEENKIDEDPLVRMLYELADSNVISPDTLNESLKSVFLEKIITPVQTPNGIKNEEKLMFDYNNSLLKYILDSHDRIFDDNQNPQNTGTNRILQWISGNNGNSDYKVGLKDTAFNSINAKAQLQFTAVIKLKKAVFHKEINGIKCTLFSNDILGWMQIIKYIYSN